MEEEKWCKNDRHPGSVYECAEDLGDKVNSIKRCVGNPKYITRTRNHLETVRTDEVKRNV